MDCFLVLITSAIRPIPEEFRKAGVVDMIFQTA